MASMTFRVFPSMSPLVGFSWARAMRMGDAACYRTGPTGWRERDGVRSERIGTIGLTDSPPVDHPFHSDFGVGSGDDRRGSSSTRDSAGGGAVRFVHERGRAAPPVAVGGEPPDSAPRRGAQRAAVPAPRAQDPDHTGGNDASRAQPADVRRPRADARGHPRHAAVGQGHAPAGRRDDGLPVRVSAAPQGVPEGASERRGEADAGRDAAPHPAVAVGHGRPRAADAAGRRSGADERAGDARRAAARDGAAAPAGAQEADHPAGPGASAVRALRGRVGHAARRSRSSFSPSTSRRRS